MILESPVFCLKCNRFICEGCSDMFTCEGTAEVDPLLKQKYIEKNKRLDASFSSEEEDSEGEEDHIY